LKEKNDISPFQKELLLAYCVKELTLTDKHVAVAYKGSKINKLLGLFFSETNLGHSEGKV
jgi:hypothetical protein